MMPILLTGFMFLYVGFPVAAVGSTSLLSKCVSLRVQGPLLYFLCSSCFYLRQIYLKVLHKDFVDLLLFLD
jgi:hypothetical protein